MDSLYTASTADASNNNISKFTGTEVVPTYAMTAGSLSASQQLQDYNATSGADKIGISDIYNWNITDANSDKVDDNTGLSRQIALQTDTESDFSITEGGIRNLVSITSPGTKIYEMGNEDGVITFKMLKNSIIKLRMYVWLEGQDVDCTNFASHGGGIEVDIGLVKGLEVGSAGASAGDDTNVTSSGTYLPTGFSEVSPATATAGLTIQDSTGNQYVWVEVPQTTAVYSTAGTGITTFTSAELTAIENDLHTYTSTYRNGTTFTDTWYSEDAQGLTETAYNELKNKMLKSVYQNGGFYVGKYEAGIQNSYRDYELSDEQYYTEHPTTETAVIKQNAYPYNWVRCSQAQNLASGLESGGYTTSLMFGVQWDLVLKYLETKGVTVAELDSDSTSWGNYVNSAYTITNTSAKHNIVNLDTGLLEGWSSVTTYSKASDEVTILSTGASETFNKMGIYDLAGNMAEWTLEYTSNSSNPCAGRGGICYINGGDYPASDRNYDVATVSNPGVGFRPSLY